MNGSRWVTNSTNPRVKAQSANVTRGNIYDRNNVLLVSTQNGKRVFQKNSNSRKGIIHVVGDEERNVANGVEGFHAGYLLGFDTTLVERVMQLVEQNQTRKGDDLVLTIDSKLSTYIYEQFSNRTGNRNGAVVVSNYQTGEILSMVSFPSFDPQKITDRLKEDQENPFWNRATQGLYPPASTFKIITLASALENLPDAQSRTMVCTGHLPVGEGAVTDAGGAAHGEITLKEAFAVSCNNVFASLALELGDKKLQKTAHKFGFDDNFLFSDLVLYNSSYPTENRNDWEIAWSGVGQSAIVATPMHMCMIAGAIANDGKMMEAKLLKQVNNNNQSDTAIIRKNLHPTVYKRVTSSQNAKVIKEYMTQVITHGSGYNASIKGSKIGGKTGSAQTVLSGESVTHAWFVGYMDDEEHPYALSIVVEKGESGSRMAAPLAKSIFNYLKKND